MEHVNIKLDNKNEIIKIINKQRLNNKNKWYTFKINYYNNVYHGKAYNTWIQLLRSKNNNHLGGCMDLTVKEFKQHLIETINK